MKNISAKISLIFIAVISLTIALEAISVGIQGIISLIAILFIIYLSWEKPFTRKTK